MSSNSKRDQSRVEKGVDFPTEEGHPSVDGVTGSVGALNLDGAVGHDMRSHQSQVPVYFHMGCGGTNRPEEVKSVGRGMWMLGNKLDNLEQSINQSFRVASGDVTLQTPGEDDMGKMVRKARYSMGKMESLAWKLAQERDELMKLFKSKEAMLELAEANLKAEEKSHQATKEELKEVNELLKGANGNFIKLQEVMREHHDLKKRFSAVKEALNFSIHVDDLSSSQQTDYEEESGEDEESDEDEESEDDTQVKLLHGSMQGVLRLLIVLWCLTKEKEGESFSFTKHEAAKIIQSQTNLAIKDDCEGKIPSAFQNDPVVKRKSGQFTIQREQMQDFLNRHKTYFDKTKEALVKSCKTKLYKKLLEISQE